MFIILFDLVGEFDYTGSLKDSEHVFDVKMRKVATTTSSILSHSHDRFDCAT